MPERKHSRAAARGKGAPAKKAARKPAKEKVEAPSLPLEPTRADKDELSPDEECAYREQLREASHARDMSEQQKRLDPICKRSRDSAAFRSRDA